MKEKILCIGEVLWDSLPAGLFLGGAPLNVSFHLHQLGEDVNIISRVGDDRLGKEALRRIGEKELPINLIQQDEKLETGIVEVQLDEEGNPDYNIIGPVAWDKIELTNQMEGAVENSWALVYGSLALRDKQSRTTIFSLLDKDILKVFDINLRETFYDKQIIKDSLIRADILKLNREELHKLIEWFSLPTEDKKAVKALADHFNCDTIAVTQGGEGAVLYRNEKWAEHRGFVIEVRDAVGAGDAFLAALLHGIRLENDLNEMLVFANAAGAYVASRSGATPEYSPDRIRKLFIEGETSET
jgi:fructokinase